MERYTPLGGLSSGQKGSAQEEEEVDQFSDEKMVFLKPKCPWAFDVFFFNSKSVRCCP
jgi:hypothetical protein